VNKSPRRTLAVMTAAAALAGGTALAGTASAAPQQPSGSQARQLQQQVDGYLAKDSGARQISANKVAFKPALRLLPLRYVQLLRNRKRHLQQQPDLRHGRTLLQPERKPALDEPRQGHRHRVLDPGVEDQALLTHR
jgi:outer membrane murein-binding lipoprotein Lpp